MTEINNENSESSRQNPRVWLLTGYRAGERSQIVALGDALGWSYQLKELSYRKSEFITSLFRGSDLRGIRCSQSSPLIAPWPDLVISAGMRNEPVCRWIRNQSGGKTRIVHIGRPWAAPDHFDLVITTPQYRLAEHPKVLQNILTLNGVTAERLAAGRASWTEYYATLPAPYTGVVLGGSSGPYSFSVHAAMQLADEMNKKIDKNGGSLLITASSRTSETVVKCLQQHLSVPYDLYQWDKTGEKKNPYFGILALSDELVVSSDSIAMLSEACATGKPVFMLELGSSSFPMRDANRNTTKPDASLKAWFYTQLMKFGPKRLGRDVRLVHKALLTERRAVWLGDTFLAQPLSAAEDMQRAVDRVKQLLL